MFAQLTYRKKCLLLSICSAMLLWAFYFFSLKPTVHLYNNYQELLLKYETIRNAPEKIETMKMELRKMESVIQDNTVLLNIQHLVLSDVTEYCKKNNLLLKELPMALIHKQDNFEIETIRVRIEGSYLALLQLNYLLEKKYPGKTTSVNFFTIKNYKTKIPSLTMDIYLQHIKSDSYEK